MPSGVYLRKAHSKETKDKMRKAHLGKRLTTEHKQKIREANIGRKHTPEARRKIAEGHKGEKSHLWRGGITPINETLRRTVEYKIWRTSVFERDNYTCQICTKRNIELQADHIKGFAQFPELRYDITNGRTLCVPCHKTTDNYTYKGRNYMHEKNGEFIPEKETKPQKQVQQVIKVAGDMLYRPTKIEIVPKHKLSIAGGQHQTPLKD